MPIKLNHMLIGIVIVLGVASLVFIGCSDDEECPVCPRKSVSWITYDTFDDDTINDSLWTHSIAADGRVLETSHQLRLWGYTQGMMPYEILQGAGLAISKHPKLGWKFSIVSSLFDEGPGCMGWHVRAVDSNSGLEIEVLNRVTAGCSADKGDTVGAYEVVHENDSIVVYKNGVVLRSFDDYGLTYFNIRFFASNLYAPGYRCYIFIDDVKGLE